jgi:lipopolysaccharide biosynthesis protein
VTSTVDWLVRVIAFYLPQFHPIPENDHWWGRGFTEWTNVVRAKPLFPGHYQPHVPAELGFYDLRVPEVRERQAQLAASHGIEGFCYWHYWFHGRRLLERPFEEMLASGKPRFPFCVAWANESWSRRWLGHRTDVLQAQAYSAADDREHARWLVHAFADARYIRVDGRPLLLVYNPGDLPAPDETTTVFRDECTRHGLPDPFLVGVSSHRQADWRHSGFDANLAFEPQLGVLPGPFDDGLKIYDYALARQRMLSQPHDYPRIPCVVVSWDNTPRRGTDGIVFLNATPDAFEAGLRDAVVSVQDEPAERRLVFVNAWNEWAEGNHLEPDERHGRAYLEAVQRATQSAVGSPDEPPKERAAGGGIARRT